MSNFLEKLSDVLRPERDIAAERFKRRAYECALWAQPVVAGNQMVAGGIEAGQKLN